MPEIKKIINTNKIKPLMTVFESEDNILNMSTPYDCFINIYNFMLM